MPAPIPIAGLSVTANIAGALTRNLGDRFADSLNVKDFGATGNGSTDDSNFIQDCFNAAYPGGAISRPLNRPVFFPAGEYRVTKPVYIMNTWGACVFGADKESTVISNSGGVTGSFVGSIAVDPASDQYSGILTVTAVTSGQLHIGDIISGGSIIEGTVIADFGTGTGGTGTYRVLRQTVGSTAFTSTSDTALYLNGVGYSTFRNFTVRAGVNGVALDYDWSNEGGAEELSSQVVYFENITFGGDIGCRVGFCGSQSDTSTWMNCAFGAPTAGLMICNQNAIAHNVYGGNFQSCGTAILTTGGSIQAIIGCGFQQSSVADIHLQGGSGDCCLIAGASSESMNFCYNQTSQTAVHITGCGHRGTGIDGYFLNGGHNGLVNITNCYSRNGEVKGCHPLTVSGSAFNRLDAFDNYASTAGPNCRLTIENCYAGDNIYGLAHFIEKRIIGPGNVKRNFEIEGASLTDTAVLYDSKQAAGDVRYSELASISNGSPALITSLHAPNLLTDTAIAFTTTGALPSPLVIGKTYYAIEVSESTFRVSETVGGAAKNTTTAGSGTHRLWFPRRFEKGDIVLNNAVSIGQPIGWICTTAGYSLPQVDSGGGAAMTPLANA